MKNLVCATLFFFSVSAYGSQFLPDNDLWKEDNIYKESGATYTDFQTVIERVNYMYSGRAAQRNEKLEIKGDWANSTVNAFTTRTPGVLKIDIYGGMARRPEMTRDALIVVLCHEIGHAYGGAPFIYPARQISAEGQSDYFGTRECVKSVVDIIWSPDVTATTPFIDRRCRSNTPANLYFQPCIRELNAIYAIGTLLANSSGSSIPNFETPDRGVVASTELSYPKTIQCRIDTMYNAVMQLVRPACWFRN